MKVLPPDFPARRTTGRDEPARRVPVLTQSLRHASVLKQLREQRALAAELRAEACRRPSERLSTYRSGTFAKEHRQAGYAQKSSAAQDALLDRTHDDLSRRWPHLVDITRHHDRTSRTGHQVRPHLSAYVIREAAPDDRRAVVMTALLAQSVKCGQKPRVYRPTHTRSWVERVKGS